MSGMFAGALPSKSMTSFTLMYPGKHLQKHRRHYTLATIELVTDRSFPGWQFMAVVLGFGFAITHQDAAPLEWRVSAAELDAMIEEALREPPIGTPPPSPPPSSLH